MIGNKKYEEALKLADNKLFSNNSVIQFQKINILMKLTKKEQKLRNEEKVTEYYDEMLKICNKEIFANVPYIQSQKINILMKLTEKEQKLINEEKVTEYYDEMLEICNKEIFATSQIIESQKRQIQDKGEMILLAINNNYLTLEEINSMEVTLLEKIIYTVAFYEKNKFSKKIILNYIKNKMSEYKDDIEILNVLNKLKNRIIQNVKIFDILFLSNFISFFT